MTQLLAKSFHGPSPPHEATVLGHLQAVHAAALTIVDTCGEAMLATFGLAVDELPRFRQIVAVAAAVHDVGKANDHFQGMLTHSANRQRYDFRQALRHEWVSLLWLQSEPVRKWMEDLLLNESDILVVECCVCGHHPGPKRPTPPASVDGAGSEMALYFRDLNFVEIMRWLQGFSQKDIEPMSTEHGLLFDSSRPDDAIVRLHRWHRAATAKFDNLSTEEQRLVAAAKACTVAADVAGSALTERKQSAFEQADWIRTTLSALPLASNVEQLAKERLGAYPERPFQTCVASSSSRVSLVTAGCGSGKTVAAWLWAGRQCPGQRLFFSYPTTGTATEGFRGYLFDQAAGESKLGAELFHSRAHVDFEVILDVNEDDKAAAIEEEQLRIHSLKAWSTPIVCCTVDTVLGIIQNQRRGLYAWPALSQSAFVFDEIHAYDEKLFGCLLRFLGDLRGAKVLLMTASLPTPRLAALEEALEYETEPMAIISGPPDLEKLERYHREVPADMDARVREELNRGGRVLWICNVVHRAMEVADRFADCNPLLYHSRFRYVDRVERHKEVIAAFEPGSSQSGCLAICTQVAEMSLDISATLLVSEIAPVPSLIQRLGRLNRHAQVSDPLPPTMPFVIDHPRDDSGELKVMPYAPDTYPNWPHLVETWLSQLGTTKISQKTLATAWENLTSEETVLRIDSTWIDGGPTTQIDSVRTSSPGVTVIRHGDAADCRSDASLIPKYSIPMPQPYGKPWTEWERIKGTIVAPDESIEYDSHRGAQWQK